MSIDNKVTHKLIKIANLPKIERRGPGAPTNNKNATKKDATVLDMKAPVTFSLTERERMVIDELANELGLNRSETLLHLMKKHIGENTMNINPIVTYEESENRADLVIVTFTDQMTKFTLTMYSPEEMTDEPELYYTIEQGRDNVVSFEGSNAVSAIMQQTNYLDAKARDKGVSQYIEAITSTYSQLHEVWSGLSDEAKASHYETIDGDNFTDDDD